MCEIWDKYRIPVKKKERKPGNIPYCGANGIIDYVEGWTHKGEFVLLAEDGGFYKAGEKSAYIMRGRFWANNHVHILKGKTSILENLFLMHYLNAIDLTPWLTGATRPKLNQNSMKKIPIPLPPLEEQRRIVARIEELMARVREARRLREEALKDTDRLWQSTLAEVFPRPGQDLPSGWRWVRLGEVCETTSGGTPSRKKREYFGGNIPWVKSGELNDSIIFDTEEKITELGLRNSNAKLFPKGTLLIAMYGATVGKLGILGCTAATNQAICALFPDKSILDKMFLFYFFLFKRKELVAQSFGGAQPNISQTVIRKIEIPLPTLEEQRRIVAYLEAVQEKIRAFKEVQTKTEAELKRLEQSILDKAFRGKL
ncbi:restriction endonuclease subunit S [Thermosulfurimonas dismutans]|uniref:restriction endonuclease subunit S n=1 Tax=Thermosulfurimonas dismutans TaxID=999894 RepID=UPI00137ABBA8